MLRSSRYGLIYRWGGICLPRPQTHFHFLTLLSPPPPPHSPPHPQLNNEFPFFKHFITSIAKCLLERPDWGMNFRVGLGAFLSITDMISDIYMIVQFFAQGHSGAAITSVAFVALNAAVQILIVVGQNTRKPRSVVLREVLLVVSCLKPGVDAYRCIRGGEKDPFLNLDSMQEMFFSKGSEVVFEAIPSSVLQLGIFLASETKTTASLVSLLMSAASTGYTSATTAYDFDTSIARRRASPYLYGMVPNEGRGFVFFLMFVLSTLQMVSKVFSIALLSLTNSTWLVIWLVSDLALFFLYKMATGDFIHCTPGLSGGVKYSAAVLERLGSKVVVDFTGSMLHRNPFGKSRLTSCRPSASW
jgi:hypothetical protein